MELQDHFLIAMPQMDDSYFHRAVIYLCEHNERGSMGIMLTHQTDLSLAELAAKLNFMMADNRIYPNQYALLGGPVTPERGFILHTKTAQTFAHSYQVSEQLTLTTSEDIIEILGTERQPEKFLISIGCSSWAANQLEREIAENCWLVAPSNEHILFDVPPESRWQAAQQLLGIEQMNLVGDAGYC
ncbi:YqgE/AlgH family protein [Pasteurellaceae bacterium LIM206]|nr:YqgE/AlgH family protein [Pasteurellaceae bacterium LIM206]